MRPDEDDRKSQPLEHLWAELSRSESGPRAMGLPEPPRETITEAITQAVTKAPLEAALETPSRADAPTNRAALRGAAQALVGRRTLANTGYVRWEDLDRPMQLALSRILGGGSLRKETPETVSSLQRLGLIEDDGQRARLSSAGWELLRRSREQIKRRRQDADARRQG